ncbi:hypothetical protein KVF89_25180 [Nocardioides carbamazepini]|jgi:hypothetical protein|uniref:hypothetical protein n=1 Tax=Nocardioides carbamazepini TaxID=2854259 RepID=UPI00214A61D9|nr:hypothetical protein [Nocardioides carbamazepini]MCR1785855.1 hypothetical protein [Nocardioides carbamazepini]
MSTTPKKIDDELKTRGVAGEWSPGRVLVDDGRTRLPQLGIPVEDVGQRRQLRVTVIRYGFDRLAQVIGRD